MLKKPDMAPFELALLKTGEGRGKTRRAEDQLGLELGQYLPARTGGDSRKGQEIPGI